MHLAKHVEWALSDMTKHAAPPCLVWVLTFLRSWPQQRRSGSAWGRRALSSSSLVHAVPLLLLPSNPHQQPRVSQQHASHPLCFSALSSAPLDAPLSLTHSHTLPTPPPLQPPYAQGCQPPAQPLLPRASPPQRHGRAPLRGRRTLSAPRPPRAARPARLQRLHRRILGGH